MDETKNNGQLAQIEGFIGAQKQWQQRFAYDSLGRLRSAREHRGDNSRQSYLINYEYDLFGNRYQYQTQNGGNPFSQSWVEAGQISQTTNRYTSGVSYDAAGNITQDTRFRNLQFQYDANNRQRWAANLDGSVAVTAVFDGAGQRLATISNGVITSISVYDVMGKLVAEYGEGGGTNGTQYLMSDHQGSPRVVTTSAGTVSSRHDYLPFGEEIYAGVGMRSTEQFYDQADGVRQKYAGMEKDDASGMAHTLWRKYDSLSGRWTTTDPYGGSMTVADPQSFNRYTYVNNDPVNHVDPTGLRLEDMGVYQTDNAQDARIAEQQSLRNFQMSMNAQYAARQGGSVGYAGNHASFKAGFPADVTANAEVNSPAAEPQNAARILIIVGDRGIGRHNAGSNFDRAAETKRQELEALGNEGIVVRASSYEDFARALINNGTLNGVEYMGHASYNALHIGEQSGAHTNLTDSDLSTLSNSNLSRVHISKSTPVMQVLGEAKV